MTDTAVCPYQDPQLARLWKEGRERGDFNVYSCCGHIKYHHKDFVCVVCAMEHKVCPMLPKRPEKEGKREGPCRDPRCEFWTPEERLSRLK